MQIVYTKTGKFAIHPARGPVIECTKHGYANLQDDYAKTLIDAKWAREFDNSKKPWLEYDWDGNSEEAKDILNDYSLKKFGIGIDKRRSVKNIIRSFRKMRREKNDD